MNRISNRKIVYDQARELLCKSGNRKILKLLYVIQGTSNCANNNGGCEQLCFHKVPTGTSCGCQLGMKLTSDSKSCEDAFKAGKDILGIILLAPCD
jgi:hypothetical protein